MLTYREWEILLIGLFIGVLITSALFFAVAALVDRQQDRWRRGSDGKTKS